MSTSPRLLTRISKVIRVAHFGCWYFPELCRVYFNRAYMRYAEKLPADVPGTTQCVKAYFGPFYIIRDDPGLRAVRKYGYYDLTLTVALERYLHPGMAVLNVGANVGYFAALAATRTGAPVLCVEPDPRCGEALTKNQQLYPELHVFPVLASDRAGVESFILDEHSTGNSSIAPSAVGTTTVLD